MKRKNLSVKNTNELEPIKPGGNGVVEDDAVLLDVALARKEYESRQRGSKRKPGDNKLDAILGSYVRPNAAEDGVLLEMTVRYDEMRFVKPLRNRLILENNATNIAEKMAIDLAIGAYLRSLRFSFSDVMCLEQPTSINSIKALAELGKQVAAANNQFFTAISFLKELKRPTVNVKVQTKEAYFAQNQQVNNDKTT